MGRNVSKLSYRFSDRVNEHPKSFNTISTFRNRHSLTKKIHALFFRNDDNNFAAGSFLTEGPLRTIVNFILLNAYVILQSCV